jgi:hypothetical protein
MDLYVFSSKTLTNIWAGIGARVWAVSKRQADNVSGIEAKASRMTVGSPGIFYSVHTHSFTRPFLVRSKPALGVVVKDIWPEEWTLPFEIYALGTPQKQLHKDKLKEILPTIRNTGREWHHVLLVQGGPVFVPSDISTDDWEILLTELADRRAS